MHLKDPIGTYFFIFLLKLKLIIVSLFFLSVTTAFSQTTLPSSDELTCNSTINGLFFEDLIQENDLPIVDGEVYYTTEIPGLYRLAAEIDGPSESLKFVISGGLNIFHTENILPYTYPGGNPTALNLGPGEYMVTMMLFTEDHLGGEMCDQLTVSFTIIEQCFIQEAFLVPEGSNAPITFENNATFCLSEFSGPISLGVEMAGSHEAVALEVRLNNQFVSLDTSTQEPYSTPFFDLAVGQYTFTATGFASNVPKATPCNQRTYTINIEECSSCPNTPFEGGQIATSPCIDGAFTIGNTVPPAFNTEPLEVIWLSSTALNDCEAATAELNGVDLGAAYDAFLSLGGFGTANPGVPGTSWNFISDFNSDALQLEITAIEATSCFIRLARVVGCEDFLGQSNSVQVDPNTCVDCDPIVDGGTITASDCDETGQFLINNETSPNAGGQAVEIAWIRSLNPSCTDAATELEGLNLGLLYDEFLESGGFSFGNPILDGTSWTFVQDNNVNDVQLTVQGLATTACFIRLARIEGCETFSGIAGPVSIDGSACVDCNFIFDGGAISAGDCNDSGSFIIQNTASPSAGNTAIESIWLMSTIGNCDQASGELSPFNVGELYDLFLAAGGFGVADPTIGGTSWQFVTDLDGDDLTLVVNEMEGEACFTRCSRIEGCERLMGESNFVSVSCVSTANDPVAVELCENILTVDGMNVESVYFVKVYNNEFTQIIYESNSFENNYTDLDEISLPDGHFILDVMLLEEGFEEEFRMTKKFSCPAECVDPLEENDPSTIKEGQSAPAYTELLPTHKELNGTLKIFPNPARDIVHFSSPIFKGEAIEVRFVNMLGQTIKTASYNASDASEFLEINVHDLDDGIYFVAFKIDEMIEEFGTLVISQKK